MAGYTAALPDCCDVGELCEGCAAFIDAIKQLVGSVPVILGNVPPDIIKVSFSLWALQQLEA